MKNIFKALSSPLFMTFLLVLLIVTLATATFIENDYGTQIARMKVYNAFWFELILFLLAVNLTSRIIELKLYKASKFSIFLFHIAFVIMIIGAAITRNTGIEGTMHIREGEASSSLMTYEKSVDLVIIDGSDKVNEQYPSQIDNRKPFSESLLLNNKKYSINLTRYYQSAIPKVVYSENGEAVIGFVLAGNDIRGYEYISEGEINQYGNFTISFNNKILSDINIVSKRDSLVIHSPHSIFISEMGEKDVEEINNCEIQLQSRKIYRVKDFNFVLQEFYPTAIITATPAKQEKINDGMKAMVFTVENGQQKTNITLWEDSWGRRMSYANIGNAKIGINYGNKIIELPFSLHLNNFVIERYPGSMSPSSFSSYVQIHEKGKKPRPYHIYMNNILKINGYRFFQSSYDNDEKGTILSVNHDPWGTGITYFSYFLLVLGMLWSLMNPKSFFRKTIVKDKTFTAILILFFIFQGSTYAQTTKNCINNAVDRKHAEEFSKLKVQNNRGRTEPIHTFASAITRKVTRKERLHGLSPAQLFLEMNQNPHKWLEMPIIRVKNPDLKQLIGITGNYAAYMDFISNERNYLLQQHVQKAYSKPPAQRSKFDKAVMKIDEKINICFGVFNGEYLRIFSVPDNPDSATWYTAHDAKLIAISRSDSIFFAGILNEYFEAVSLAKTDGNYANAYKLLGVIKTHQVNNAVYELHSPIKIETEVFYNKVNPFKKLFPFYMALGVLHLFFLIIFITIGRNTPKIINNFFFYTILAGFALHTLGIAARWYISGYAPMSNGYETIVFIAWVTVLAGFIFNKRSAFSLTATSVVAGLALMVANLNFMDPVITNLVPVLQSYWLTIHVSVITAGYGFLALGAILGIINLVLTVLRTNKNHNNIVNTILELTTINHKSLIIGLYLLTIGSFLGAVWANESWGRYWGWDPKETWALISILVYTLITHARLIPGLKGVFVLNALSLWGFSSILMTFFGVNYYLSGLHSYAGGDPVSVPMFVYYTVFIFIVLSMAAWFNYNKFKKTDA